MRNNKKRLAVDKQESVLRPNKRQKQETRRTTPSYFWDNLSKLFLSSRSLRDFDKRTKPTKTEIRASKWCGKRGNADWECAVEDFARSGGPGLEGLRAYPEPESAINELENVTSHYQSSSIQTQPEDGSIDERCTSSYDDNLKQHLVDHGIYSSTDIPRRNRPSNWEELKERLSRRRSSLSSSRFTSEDFEKFQGIGRVSNTDKALLNNVMPIIAGASKFPSRQNLRFSNLKDLTDESIPKAQPSLYDGLCPSELDRRLLEHLESYIVPSKEDAKAPYLPNFITEVKYCHYLTCKRQALYTGALGARAMLEGWKYADPKAAYENRASTMVCCLNEGGLLSLHTCHASLAPSENGETQITYTTHFLKGVYMQETKELRKGMTCFRNARDWADEERKRLVLALNAKAGSAPGAFD